MSSWFDTQLDKEGMPPELCSVFNEQVEQFSEEGSTELERAGVDASTDSSVFLQMQGRNIFVVGEHSEVET